MRTLAIATVALLVTGASGIRMRRKHRGGRGLTGKVAGTYAAASPSVSSPPLENPQSDDNCFPGIRTWTFRDQWWGHEADLVTTVAGTVGFRHPYMRGYGLNLKRNTVKAAGCNSEAPNIPRGTPKMDHDLSLYVDMQQKIDAFMVNMSRVGLAHSQIYEKDSVRASIANHDWNLVETVIDEGGKHYVGRQVSHLIQSPHTLECVVTFQGSASYQDWMANFQIEKTHFCGLVSEDQSCGGLGQCNVKRQGESFVHKGFRDATREMVQNVDWQNKIRPKLPSCSKVYVTGHSLGGAQALLFSACAAQNLQPGDFGYEEDYKYIKWTQGTPKLLDLV